MASKKCLLTLLGVIGVVLFAASLAMLFVFPRLVSKKIEEQLPLRNSSESTKKWSKVSVPIYFKIHVFDVTNAQQFQDGLARPHVRERGPYVFFQTREKDVVDWSNDTEYVSFNDLKTFYFDPKLSAGSLDDEVNVINAPLVGIIEKLMARNERSPLSMEVLSSILNGIFASARETLIIKKKVREILFEGYHVNFVNELIGLTQKFGMPFQSPLPNNTFGLFYRKNGSSPGLYSINTGTTDVMQLKQISTFRNRPRVPHWTADTCNQINGTDGSAFHPRLTRDETLYLFNVDLCRSLYLTYERDSNVRGIQTYKYSVPDKFFKAPANEPDNACFCTSESGFQDRMCQIDGIMDVSRCKKGAPIILSAPHFYKADPYLVNHEVKGLRPEKALHETFLEIEPLTGLVLNAARRIQINVHVTPRTHFDVVSRIDDTIIPFIWAEESARADEKAANLFKSKIQNKLVLGNALTISIMALGLGFFLISVTLLILQKRRENTLKDSSSQDSKKSYSSLPQKEVPVSL